jgi:O-acetyl-ADP-ribose deacetylase (regulator of RNase III)
MNIVKGDLLEAKEQFIAHQCNAISQNAGGLAFYLFSKFPYSNVYRGRIKDDIPGTIKVMGDGDLQRYVINMFAQYRPGPPSISNPTDNRQIREIYFAKCLEEISKIPNLQSIAFPYMVGCGLARGIWSHYLKMLEDFSNKNNNIEVVIYNNL